MSLRSVKLLLAAIIGCFAVATAYISILAVERQEALKQVSRDNIAWLGEAVIAPVRKAPA